MSDIADMYGTADDDYKPSVANQEQTFSPDVTASQERRIANLERSLAEATRKLASARSTINRLTRDMVKSNHDIDKLWAALERKVNRSD